MQFFLDVVLVKGFRTFGAVRRVALEGTVRNSTLGTFVLGGGGGAHDAGERHIFRGLVGGQRRTPKDYSTSSGKDGGKRRPGR